MWRQGMWRVRNIGLAKGCGGVEDCGGLELTVLINTAHGVFGFCLCMIASVRATSVLRLI